MECTPTWLTKLWVEDVLRENTAQAGRQGLKVVSIRATAADGEGFTSSVVRVHAELAEGNDESVIIKLPLPLADGQVNEMDAAFPHEARMYGAVLPRLEQLLEQVGLGGDTFGPRMLRYQQQPGMAIVLDDLKPLGYCGVDKQIGWDWDHMTLVSRKVARFHAAAVRLHQEMPDELESFKPFVGEHNIQTFTNYYLGGWDHVIAEVGSWGDALSNRIIAKLLRLRTNFTQRMMDTYRRDSSRFCVLNHGDMWPNNVMFKYSDSGKVESTRFLDFQMCYWSTPALDLHYMITLGSSKELRQDRGEKILQAYHQELSECLRALGVQDIPTLDYIKREMRRTTWIKIMALCVSMPLLLNSGANKLDYETALMNKHSGKGPHPRALLLKNPNWQAIARDELDYLDREGLLDSIQ